MLKEIVLASNNQGKIAEFNNIFSELGITIKSLAEFGDMPDIVEDGSTFEENAKKKAETIKNIINIPVIADDSGLMVDYLNGEPGIYSARFAGEEKNDEKNNQKLLSLLEGVNFENRKARFVCAIALAIPNRETIITRGICEGYIGQEFMGSNGFGYDPLFYLPEYDKTMAEIEAKLKNNISHRSKALKELIKVIDYHF